MDYNRENGTVVFIYNVLDLATDKEYRNDSHDLFVVQQGRLITISNQDNAYVVDILILSAMSQYRSISFLLV